jgi:MSHA biogenesis protein MshE
MGAPAYMVASSVHAVLAQRLVRVICESCAGPHAPDLQEEAWLTSLAPDLASARFMQGKGCSQCNGTGYAGRTGVYELVEMTQPLMEVIGKEDPNEFRRRAHQQIAGATMRDHALKLAAAGRTTLAEVIATEIEE